MPIRRGTPSYIEYQIGNNLVSQWQIRNFEYVSTIVSECNVHRIVITNPPQALINVRDLSGTVPLSFKFGWVGTDNSDVHIAKLVDFDIELLGTGSNIYVTGGDISLNINRGVKNRGFSSMKISQIVSIIAGEHNLQAEIEETIGAYTVRQIHMSDMAFIKKILLPKSVSASSRRGDYEIYIDYRGKLHFHPPKYSSTVFKEYVWGGEELKEARVSFHGELANALGGLSTTVHGYDPFEKRILSHTAANENTLEKEVLGAKTCLLELPRGYREGRYYHNGTQTETEVRNEALVRRYRADRIRYTGVLVVVGEPKLEAGCVINFVVPLVTGGYHAISGRYLVQAAKHTITANDYFTTLYIARNGIAEGDDLLVGVKRAQINATPVGGVTVSSTPLGS